MDYKSIFFLVMCVNMVFVFVEKFDGTQISPWGLENVRTLRPPGKLEELTHEMRRYCWSVLGRTLAKQLLRMDISFTSVAKRSDMKMVLVFLFTRTP